jgi:hypothetical protein
VGGSNSARAFAATWRNERGDVVATTSARSMCLWPRLPWRIRFSRDGFEGVIPCRECPGCLELERMRLESRLLEKYPDANDRLFVVRIYAPIETHAALSHALHRRPRLQLEAGFFRCGASGFLLITRAPAELRIALSRLGLNSRSDRILLKRGRRAWRPLSAGLVVSRAVYGEQKNRFYSKGLPQTDRQKWEVRKIATYQRYDRARSPRAFKRGGVVLVPPEVWQLSRTDRRALRGVLSKAPDPEGVSRVMRLVAGVLESRGGERSDGVDRIRSITTASQHLPTSGSNVIAGRGAASGLRHTAAEYRKLAELSSSTATPMPPSDHLPPFSEMGGYTSSEHSQGELMPEELAQARRKDFREGRKRKALEESMAIIERMRKKSLGGE